MAKRSPLVLAIAAASASALAGSASSHSAPAPRVCSPPLASQRPLAQVRTTMVLVGDGPFGVASSVDGRWAFVSRVSGQVALVDARGRKLRTLRQIVLSAATAAGETLSRDGRLLLVATGSGATVIDVAKAERGVPDPVVGKLSAAGGPKLDSAIEVAVSADGRDVFVSLESANEIAVFDLRRALKSGFRESGLVGMIPLGQAPVGLALSPDGRWLYATSELGGPNGARTRGDGTISVIDARRAELHPRGSVVASARSGCGPVRVAVSPDGSIVWVAARESNALLAFSARRLRSDPSHAELARVRIGPAPVGLALLRNGTRVVVADSNRFEAPGQRSGLTLVDASAALAHRPAVIGVVRAGSFPREVTVEKRRRRLLVTNTNSGQLEVVDTSRLP